MAIAVALAACRPADAGGAGELRLRGDHDASTTQRRADASSDAVSRWRRTEGTDLRPACWRQARAKESTASIGPSSLSLVGHELDLRILADEAPDRLRLRPVASSSCASVWRRRPRMVAQRMDLTAQDPVARRAAADRSVAVVEQADVGCHEDAHASVVRVDCRHATRTRRQPSSPSCRWSSSRARPRLSH